jgi:NitT/TauT family transport system permease protein
MKTIDLSPSQTEQDKRFPPVSQVRWRLFGIGVVTVWLLVWELSIQYVLGQLYFVPPSVMLRSFYRSLLVTGELGPHLWATVIRLVSGLVVGAVPAVWLDLRIGRNERTRLHYGPFLAAVGLIPVIASFPFFIVMFGVRDLQKWAMVAAAVFYPILYCTTKGVQISRTLQVAGKSPVEGVIRSDWLRGPGPWIFTGLKLGSIIGFATLLGAEMYASTRGLGFEIIVAMQKLNLVYGYVGMLAAALVMYVLWLSLTAIESAVGRSVSVRDRLAKFI